MKAPTWDEWFDAMREGKLAVVKAGLQAGFDPNSCDPPSGSKGKADPPLHRAMGNTRGKKVALFLLEHGANPNTPDKQGMTPLMWAASYGDLTLIAALMKAGANPRARLARRGTSLLIENGLTPREIALADGHKKAAELIDALASGKAPSAASPLEQKLSALREAAFPVLDFEGSEEAVEAALVGVDRPDCFHTIGKTGSDSVFALWTRQPGAPLEQAPVVYLDSEGDPRAAVASSLDEFLSVLPYGSAALYELLSTPDWKFTASKQLKEAGGAEDDVEDQAFLTWWKRTFGVGPARNPAAVVAAATKQTLAFQRWLEPGPT